MPGVDRESHGWGWKRAGRLLGGWGLILVGLAGCVLPVLPGVPLILGGLALLAPEYEWARRWMDRLKGWIERLRKRRDRNQTSPEGPQSS